MHFQLFPSFSCCISWILKDLQHRLLTYMSLTTVNCLQQSIMNENILFFSLNQKISLITNMMQEFANTDFPFVTNLLQHSIQDNVSPCPAYASTENQSQTKTDIKIESIITLTNILESLARLPSTWVSMKQDL